MEKKNASNQKKINLIKGNLSSDLKERILGLNLKESPAYQERKEILYNYPASWGKREIGGIEGKNFRGKLRNQLMNLILRILLFQSLIYKKLNPKENLENLKLEIEKFKLFYASNYRINNFEISSISQKKNSDDIAKISDAMQIIKSLGLNKIASKKDASKGIKKDASKSNSKGIAKDKKKDASKSLASKSKSLNASKLIAKESIENKDEIKS